MSPLGTNLIFSSPLGLLRFQEFLSFLFILKLSYSKPLYSTLSYASTVNIQEVIKFYNPGNKSFETDLTKDPVLTYKLSFQNPYAEGMQV